MSARNCVACFRRQRLQNQEVSLVEFSVRGNPAYAVSTKEIFRSLKASRGICISLADYYSPILHNGSPKMSIMQESSERKKMNKITFFVHF